MNESKSMENHQHNDLAHELWAASQLLPGEGITDGVDRIQGILDRTEFSALMLVAKVRAALGDPEGKLMQGELLERCKEMRSLLKEADDALDNIGVGAKGSPIRVRLRKAYGKNP